MEELKQKVKEMPNDFDFGRYVRHAYNGNDATINQIIANNSNDQALGAAMRVHVNS